jgi:chromosomal replication initiation ATPase DnaA
MWMIREKGNNSLCEIGEFVGELDYAGVAQRIRRVRFSHDANAARKLMTEF